MSSFLSSFGFEFGAHEAQMTAEQANFDDISSIQGRDAFHHQRCDFDENELKSRAAELGAPNVREYRGGQIHHKQNQNN